MNKPEIWEFLSRDYYRAYLRNPAKDRLDNILTAVFIYTEVKTHMDEEIPLSRAGLKIRIDLLSFVYESFIGEWLEPPREMDSGSFAPWIDNRLFHKKQEFFSKDDFERPSVIPHVPRPVLIKTDQTEDEEVVWDKKLLDLYYGEMNRIQERVPDLIPFFLFNLRCGLGFKTKEITELITLRGIEDIVFRGQINNSIKEFANFMLGASYNSREDFSAQNWPETLSFFSRFLELYREKFCREIWEEYVFLPSEKILGDESRFERFLKVHFGIAWKENEQVRPFLIRTIRSKLTWEVRENKIVFLETASLLDEKDTNLFESVFYRTYLIPKSAKDLVTREIWRKVEPVTGEDITEYQLYKKLEPFESKRVKAIVMGRIQKFAKDKGYNHAALEKISSSGLTKVLSVITRNIVRRRVDKEIRHSADIFVPQLDLSLQVLLNSVVSATRGAMQAGMK